MLSFLERFSRKKSLSSTLSGFTRVHLLRVGLQLGLFEELRKPQQADQLVARLDLAPDLANAWLRAAHAHRLLDRSDAGAYRTSGFARWFLDAPESASLRALVDQVVEDQGPAFARLPALLTGAERPGFRSAEETERCAQAARLVEHRALEALGRLPGARSARRVLDIGCGYGTYLSGLLLRYRDAQGIGIEHDPVVAEGARRQLREADVARRGSVRVGDIMTMDIPKGTFDLILLNNNLYYFPPSEYRTLFSRCLDRLVGGGILAIQLPVISEALGARLAGLYTTAAAFDLFLHCHGDFYGLPDLDTIHAALKEVGFASVGETAILPGGAARYVWARAARG